jgi:hypothetical protein
MMSLHRALSTALSAASGAVVGLLLGFYGPFAVAMMRGDDPIHRGRYADWIEVLIVIGPIVVGGALAAVAWFGRLRALRIAVHCLTLVAMCWQLLLMLG